MIKSAREREKSARKVPYNLDNLKKYSYKTKMSELEHGPKASPFIQSGMLSPGPLKLDHNLLN